MLENTDLALTNVLLSGNLPFNRTSNSQILNATIEYILSTKVFGEPLF